MSPKQIKRLQIFIILFLSSLTLYVLFKEVQKRKALNAPLNTPKKASQENKKKEKQEGKQLPIEDNKAPNKTPEAKEESKESTPRKLSAKQKETLESFRQQALAITDKLPLKSDLQKLEEGQTHSIPQSLLATGRELGKLKEMVIKYPDFPELQKEAKTYYKACADQDQYPTSIRSLCLYNRLQLAKNNNEDFDITPYPLEIKQLVLELAPFRKQ